MSPHLELDLLADHLEGLLAPEESADVERHLADCAPCRARVDDLRGVSDLLAAQPEPQMPPHLQQRIEQALVAEQRSLQGPSTSSLDQARSRRTRMSRVLLAAAAAVVVVGVGGTLLDEVGIGGDTSSSQSERGAGTVQEQGDAPEAASPSEGSAPSPSTLRREGADSGVAPRVQSAPSVIEDVFETRTVLPLRQRSSCVGEAVGDRRWEGTSYAVDLDGAPAAVAFLGDPDNTAREVTGILVRCGPQPEVVERQQLRR